MDHPRNHGESAPEENRGCSCAILVAQTLSIAQFDYQERSLATMGVVTISVTIAPAPAS